ncbi:hypothetical protein PTKIN_Ptkin09bG0006900 [Pterospermum kingtungense]
MKNYVMIFFGLVLVFATLEADGKPLTGLKEEEELILSAEASTHKLGRKADVGAKDDKGPTANYRGGATGRTAEDDPAVALLDSQEGNLTDNLQHRKFTNGTNPWAPAPRRKP